MENHASKDKGAAAGARPRSQLPKVIGVGIVGAVVVWLGLTMWDGKQNPCEQVRDRLCKLDARSLACQTSTSIRDQSARESDPAAREALLAQCLSKLQSLDSEPAGAR